MNGKLTALGAAVLFVSTASFAGDWKKDHPRRAEVNQRLKNQDRRINEGVENGTLSRQQAHQLHQEDRAMRQQERSEAAEHGGHLTKGEQRQLNREENAESRQIYQEKHP